MNDMTRLADSKLAALDRDYLATINAQPSVPVEPDAELVEISRRFHEQQQQQQQQQQQTAQQTTVQQTVQQENTEIQHVVADQTNENVSQTNGAGSGSVSATHTSINGLSSTINGSHASSSSESESLARPDYAPLVGEEEDDFGDFTAAESDETQHNWDLDEKSNGDTTHEVISSQEPATGPFTLSPEKIAFIKSAMQEVSFPNPPTWAQAVPEELWMRRLRQTLSNGSTPFTTNSSNKSTQ